MIFNTQPIQTRVWDILQRRFLAGDSTNNLFTHPDTGTTEGLSEYLAQPSRYEVHRWTGEVTQTGQKIFVFDELLDESTGLVYRVFEDRSATYMGGGSGVLYHLRDAVAALPTLRHLRPD